MPPLENAPRDAVSGPSFAAEFSPALINPERETPAAVTGPNGKLAVKRFNVYRNNVIVSLIDALASIYPAVQRITGVDFFRAMARFHIRATPPYSPLLFEYGRDFPAFIEHYEYAQSMPYLADVARIERAWLDAYHATDASPLAPEALAAVPPERLADIVFMPHPATRIVRSQFSAVTIFAANRTDAPIDLIESVVPEDALITRPDLEVVVRHLPLGGAIFLTHLVAGETLGAAVAAALEIKPLFDIPASISGMIEAGAFTTINFGDER
ncbi:MAG: DNA-binding domain-containing protein [Methylovirgula sp.]|uniref:HvfC/BufC N-terminal domain-containing protein n=1 Tax=Methylovirgula sp. TaxID=1978224 RepID=UPI0030764B41